MRRPGGGRLLLGDVGADGKAAQVARGVAEARGLVVGRPDRRVDVRLGVGELARGGGSLAA